MLPINSPSDYTGLLKTAKLCIKRFKPTTQTNNTYSAKVMYSNEISVEGLMTNICFVSKVGLIKSDLTDYTTNDASIESCLKACVERVKVTYND
jgi:hypothetical protein